MTLNLAWKEGYDFCHEEQAKQGRVKVNVFSGVPLG